MPDLVTMGANAAQIYRVALSTVSNNIANVGNEIYSRQQTILSAGAPAKVGVVNIGTGANLDYIYRSYNEFIESSMRNSSSSLKTQETLINYTDRIINIMASDQGNLLNAIDGFYSSLNRLELDSANIGIRNELLSSGNYLASRINELATEVQNIRKDSQGELEKNLVSINKLAESLFKVNQELNRNNSIKLQSPSMLDQRDSLLSQLAQYVDLNVRENENGTVIVGISGPASSSILVDTVRQRQIGVQSHSLNGNIQGLVVDTYSNPTFIGVPKEGVIAGLIQLDNEVTQRLTDELNIFAKTFVDTINSHHRQGLDLTNSLGGDMFQIAPTYVVKNHGGVTDNSFVITGIPSEDINPFSLTAVDENSWVLRDLLTDNVSTLRPVVTDGGINLSYKGLDILLPQVITKGATYQVIRKNEPAQEVVFNLDDPRKIAAAARLHVQADATNSNKIQVSIDYSGSRSEPVVMGGIDIGNYSHRNVDLSTSATGILPSFSVPPKFGEFSVKVMGSIDAPLNFQVFNNDFVRLDGLGGIDPSDLASIKNSGLYSNKRFVDAKEQNFPQKDIFIGSKGVGELISQRANPQLDGGTIAAGALELNGVALPELNLQQNSLNHPADIATWINKNSTVKAEATNKVRVESNGIKFTETLTLNGVAIDQAIDLEDMVNNINAKTPLSGVRAYLNNQKNLILSNDFGREGSSIEVSGLALGIAQSIYTGQVIFSNDGDIQFTIGANGSSIDLARLGLELTISGKNTTNNSLQIYAKTATGIIDASLKVTEKLPESDPVVESPFIMEFFDDQGKTYFQIKDISTGVVIQEREHISGTDILLGKLEIALELDPKAGDKFTFTKNTDAFGDNKNLRKLSATENEELYNGFSARIFYSNQVNRVGAVSDLAKLNRDAAEILYDENRVKKSSLSGVNLDQEAAELMRYQQAFQASAQLIQVSTKLFDAIISAS
jgi:flagellar hook-associated protein FlgK